MSTLSRITSIAVLISLIGCSGAPKVIAVPEGKTALKGKGVFYYLPKTEVEIQLELTISDFKPGVLSDCSSDKTECDKFSAYNLKPAKDVAEAACTSDKNISRFFEAGEKTTLLPIAVPDISELYFIDITTHWWQSIKSDIEFSELGFATSATGGGSSLVPDIANGLISVALSSVWNVRHSVFNTETDAISELGKKRQAALKRLEEIKKRREDIALRNQINGDPTAVLAALDEMEKETRELFSGTVKSTTITVVKRIPIPERDATGNLDPKLKTSFDVPSCNKDQLAKFEVAVHLKPDSQYEEIANRESSKLPSIDEDDKGIRYRLPIPVVATLLGSDGKPLVDGKDFRFEVAQYGPTLYLPRRAGVWGGTVGSKFVGNSGRLSFFSTDTTSGAKPIITVIQTELTKDREIDKLKREEQKLDLEEKIKDHKKAAEGSN